MACEALHMQFFPVDLAGRKKSNNVKNHIMLETANGDIALDH